MKNYLNFESEIKNLEVELDKLKDPYNQEGLSEVDTKNISKLQNEIDTKLKDIYSNLDPWQKTLVARHEDRPKAKHFIDNLFEDFISLSGDRFYGEDKSVICGFAKFEKKSILVIGQEKGENLETRIERNFGMMRPEGYRKTIRLMNLANKFKIPVISFIDTPGAYPGVGAEERGQAEAIARSIECCMDLSIPTISIIIGEGGSGGAIALASSNKVLMLENSIYSVISPEGCATILWRDPKKTLEASQAMKLSSKDLLELKIIDEIILEPLGGAHRDKDLILDNVRNSIRKNLDFFSNMNKEEILLQRKNKFLSIGRSQGFGPKSKISENLSIKTNIIDKFINKIFFYKKYLIYLLIFIVLVFSITLYVPIFLLPVFLGEIKLMEPTDIGIIISTLGIAWMISGPFVGYLLKFIGARVVVIIGCFFIGSGALLQTQITSEYMFNELFFSQLLKGFGAQFLWIGNQYICLASIDQKKVKNASSMFNLILRLGAAIFIALSSNTLVKWQKIFYSEISNTYNSSFFYYKNEDYNMENMYSLLSEREGLIMALNNITFISMWTVLIPILLMFYVKTDNKKELLY